MTRPQEQYNPDELPGHRIRLATDTPLTLASGAELSDITVAYETYGKLNADKTNAILICHALTGDQYVATPHPITGKPGWWDNVVGPGKILDTDHYFIICSNVLGGCMGTTGPMSINPETGKPWGVDFPMITIADMVELQKLLVDEMGIEKLFGVVGGSAGGMQALQWAAQYPDKMDSMICIAAAARHSAQNIAYHEVGRQSIMADPDWHGGNYYEKNTIPRRGLSVARMTAHITYLSETALTHKFGRGLQDRTDLTYGFDADFQVESYLRHQGISFVDRFDANSYLYVTRALDYFDLAASYGGNLAKAFDKSPVRFCIISFNSDWLYPTSESRNIVHALNAAGADVSFAEIDSDKGHDAFLLKEPEFFRVLQGFVDGCAERAGLEHVDHEEMTEDDSAACLSPSNIRLDHKLISDFIAPDSRVLDIGCGDGELLSYLCAEKEVDGLGIELSMEGVRAGVRKGLSVIQGDADVDLHDYPDNSFDYAILSHTLQAMKNPREVMEQLVRISRHAVVSFPNFGHWQVRKALFFGGHMPVNDYLPYSWYDTPNIHFCTIADFTDLCNEAGIEIEQEIILNEQGQPIGQNPLGRKFANLIGQQAVYLLKSAAK